jgi:peptide subunit release factor 1 (eRF1)
MQETLIKHLKAKKVGLVRADSGFYTEALQSYLEEKQLNYIMAVKTCPNVKSEVWGLNNWVELIKGIELN